ncbi:hypothetical protein GXN76_01710 [Kroppenstedtia pulmonis]|uniref:Uncharacterized protein n=1 Tax=Kroppenstedtia pulmonis TaxID=1380685 RepID=A0A7D3XQA6_9BACL|nr:hypothetical protein [Kroppenstedtia pulmonis]QKG83308.1 hypothetical protein GXN76_01710 [Kroppenstedtia pulmonis]
MMGFMKGILVTTAVTLLMFTAFVASDPDISNQSIEMTSRAEPSHG